MSARAGFLERNVAALSATLDQAVRADDVARSAGLLQGLDARTKILGLFALVILAASTYRLAVIGTLFAVAAVLAVTSRVPLQALTRVWTGVLLFTGLIAVPALFFTSGAPVLTLPFVPIRMTDAGFLAAVRLVGRAETTATLASVLILTTPWAHLLKALRVLHVPRIIVVILGMTHRYIFLLLGLARDYFEARRSRQVGRLDSRQRRDIGAATAGVLLGRSLALSNDVYLAMQSRGFRGEIYLLQQSRFRARDAVAAVAFVGVALACGL